MATSAFRPIYYLGCKNEFSAQIRAAIDDVDPSGGRLGDIFAGTGSVAASLSYTREVLTVDIQEYSRVICSAVLNPAGLDARFINELIVDLKRQVETGEKLWCFQPLIEYEAHCHRHAAGGNAAALVALLESQPVGAVNLETLAPDSQYAEAARESTRRLKERSLWCSPNTTVARLFGGVYFSYEQAVWLDQVLESANGRPGLMRDTLVAAALSAASSIVNTVGKQFAQPIRPRNKDGATKAGLESVVRRDRSMDVVKTYRGWLQKYSTLPQVVGSPICLRRDYLEAINQNASKISVLYADPPYTRDHYSRFYHVLETMCLRDNPSYSMVTKGGESVVSRGLYRQDRHQSEFCVRSQAPKAFAALFHTARESDLPLVLSYSPHEAGDGTHPRVVSMEQVVDLAKSRYKRVEVVVIDGSTHNVLNRTGLKLQARQHAEILLKCYR